MLADVCGEVLTPPLKNSDFGRIPVRPRLPAYVVE